jgi:hypothetical protein
VATVRYDTWSPAGDVPAIDLVECLGLRKSLRLAVGIGGRLAALFPRSQTTIDAIAVCVVGDDEHTPLGLCRAGKPDQNGKADQNCSHGRSARDYGGAKLPRADSENVSKSLSGA